MQRGQWVAFDVSTEEPHVCGTQHEPDIAIKLKGKNKSRTKEDESIDLGYGTDEVSDDLDEIEEESDLSSNDSENHFDMSLQSSKRQRID